MDIHLLPYYSAKQGSYNYIEMREKHLWRSVIFSKVAGHWLQLY